MYLRFIMWSTGQYNLKLLNKTPGGTGLERGMGIFGPENPLFTPLLQFARVPFQAKESVHKTPFLRKFGNFSLYSLNFPPNFSSQAPNLEIFSSQAPNWEIFSSQAPKFGNFQFTSPLLRGKYQFASPTLRKSRPHTPTWKKKKWVPPPGMKHLRGYNWLPIDHRP